MRLDGETRATTTTARATRAEATSPPPALRVAGAPPSDGSSRRPGPAPASASLRETLIDGLDSLYRFILVRTGMDAQSAADVLQQTALVALDHDGVPTEPSAREGWLRGIARNLIRRHWRLASRSNGVSRNGAMRATLETMLAERSSPGPDDALLQKDAQDHLLFAIASLCHEDQRLLYDFYRHGKTRAEIAERLGVTPKSVEARLYRMRARLREMMMNADGSGT